MYNHSQASDYAIRYSYHKEARVYTTHLYSPIARSAICGESLVFIKKSLELAAKYVTQRMHHLLGHWF